MKEFPLGPYTRIGRHPSQDVQVLDRLVSKEHCIIEYKNGHYVMTDLTSRNGTLVNNRVVDRPVILSNGDNITLGSTQLVYIAQPTEEVALSRVTIDPQEPLSPMRSAVVTSGVDFKPEYEISDLGVLRGDYEKLRLAFMLNQEVALEVNLNRLLKKINEVLFRAFQIDRSIIFLIDGYTKELLPKNIKTAEGEDDSENIRVSHTILEKVLREKTAILSSDAMYDDRFVDSHSVIMQGIRSTMTVPLLSSEDKVLGVIHMDSHVATNVFTERDLQIIQGFSRQAALAIENSLLLENIRQQELARIQYERLLSPAVVEKIVNGKVDIQKGGELRRVT
ncbi:MAG: FHA domain-containing protein, partial [Myxococcales bacterium]|nr:FHA domain-containing protein [Myxococcales bacterium]